MTDQETIAKIKGHIKATKKAIRHEQASGRKDLADALKQDLAFFEDDLHYTKKSMEDAQ